MSVFMLMYEEDCIRQLVTSDDLASSEEHIQ